MAKKEETQREKKEREEIERKELKEIERKERQERRERGEDVPEPVPGEGQETPEESEEEKVRKQPGYKLYDVRDTPEVDVDEIPFVRKPEPEVIRDPMPQKATMENLEPEGVEKMIMKVAAEVTRYPHFIQDVYHALPEANRDEESLRKVAVYLSIHGTGIPESVAVLFPQSKESSTKRATISKEKNWVDA
jgi:hypothetical protein